MKAPKISDDPIHGAVRAAICDEYIAAGKPEPKENWLYTQLVQERLRTQDLFCIRWQEMLVSELQEMCFDFSGNESGLKIIADHIADAEKRINLLRAQLTPVETQATK